MSKSSVPVGPSEEAQIRAAALDYIEAWNTADAARMERALHPDLAKRQYVPCAGSEPKILPLSPLTLIHATRKANDKPREADVQILDRYEGIASVRVTVRDWVEYMHLVKVIDEWKILNILWQHRTIPQD